MENNVPMQALKSLYQEISLIHVIEIETIDVHEQVNMQYQVTASHPDFGLVTIRQKNGSCEMLADYEFDFDSLTPVLAENTVSREPFHSIIEGERLAEEGFMLIQALANDAGISITRMKYSFPAKSGKMLES